MGDTFYYFYVGDAVIEKEGSVRLVGGAQPHEGLVEMFLFDQWGTLQTQLQLQLDSVKCQHYLSAAGLPWSILNDDVSESKKEFRLTIEPEGIAQLVPSDETVI